MLRLADRPADEMAWFRVLQLLEGVGPARARRAVDRLVADGGELAERWARRARASCSASALELADPLRRRDRRRRRRRAGSGASSACATCSPRSCAATTSTAPCACRTSTRSPGWPATRRDLRTFVAELVLDPPASAQDLAGPPHLDDDWLVLSTVHSAKGLEWQSVHLLAAYDGNFPA